MVRVLAVIEMARTVAQRAARRARKKRAKSNGGAGNKRGPLQKNGKFKTKPVRKRNRKNRKQKTGFNPAGGRQSIPGVMSAVNDGVNTGMVWKNSTHVVDFFKPRLEKVTDLVTTTTAFTIIKQFFVNPGNSVLFPVFSKIAASYEQYRCHMLRFWYRGEEYTASGTNVSSGIIAYATNMDVDDTNFVNIDQMENYDDSESGPPFAGHFCHDVLEVHKKRGRNRGTGASNMPLNDYFVFSSANSEAPTGLSQAGKWYDMGNFQIASNGTQSATPAGELWVEHSWTMIRRKQSTPLGQELLSAHWVESPAASAAAAGSAFLGTAGGILRTGSNWPGVATGSTFTLPVPGVFLIAGVFNGSVTVAPAYALGANVTALVVQTDNLNSLSTAVSGGTTVSVLTVTVGAAGTGAANTVTISGLTNLAAGKSDVFIAQMPGGIMLLKKSSVEGIEMRLREIEKRLLSRICEEPDSDFEEKSSSSSSSSSLSLDRSVHLSRDAVRQLLIGK